MHQICQAMLQDWFTENSTSILGLMGYTKPHNSLAIPVLWLPATLILVSVINTLETQCWHSSKTCLINL